MGRDINHNMRSNWTCVGEFEGVASQPAFRRHDAFPKGKRRARERKKKGEDEQARKGECVSASASACVQPQATRDGGGDDEGAGPAGAIRDEYEYTIQYDLANTAAARLPRGRERPENPSEKKVRKGSNRRTSGRETDLMARFSVGDSGGRKNTSEDLLERPTAPAASVY